MCPELEDSLSGVITTSRCARIATDEHNSTPQSMKTVTYDQFFFSQMIITIIVSIINITITTIVIIILIIIVIFIATFPISSVLFVH